MANSQAYDVAIIGGGIAGLSVALHLPGQMRVALFTKGQLGESNTRYAQGGLTAALGADDSPDLHFQDTIAAGAGLCDENAIRVLVEQAPAAVNWLIQHGVQFDRAQPGSNIHTTSATNAIHTTPDGLLLGREAAHSRWRVLHAGGDATGAEIERALMAALQKHPRIAVYEETYVSALLIYDGVCTGLEAIDKSGQPFTIEAKATVLANGGAGGLWLHTSNPAGATADGLALAWRAGAVLSDLEFMQFHPTVLAVNGGSHLVSEAVRGEGAFLRNHAGERFMPRYGSRAELEPRDVVARAILSEMLSEGTDCQYLDLRHLPAEKMYARFPTISAICRKYGLDLARDLLPVAPAAHYCMGGVMVDTYGRSTLLGLYAVGEVACTGVHGANRLASNSLLEGLVFGLRLADGLQTHPIDNGPPYIVGAIPCGRPETWPGHLETWPDIRLGHPEKWPDRHTITIPVPTNSLENVSTANAGPVSLSDIRREVRSVMWQYVSLCRDEEGLLEARRRVHALKQSLPAALDIEHGGAAHLAQWAETRNMLLMAELVIIAAMQRRESRGSHWRRDYETLDASLTGRHFAYVQETTVLTPENPRKEVIAHA
ncbi:MAG: L-aspartate oxidase [Ktedonobacter sp. 13_2_20CM_53_11]|nr:MAG: L-aspartate oxidase [Ktedonobacter sp. 13_2_20CM_53_11]